MVFKHTMGFEGARDIALETVKRTRGRLNEVEIITVYQSHCEQVFISEGLSEASAHKVISMAYFYADTKGKNIEGIITALGLQHEFALALIKNKLEVTKEQ